MAVEPYAASAQFTDRLVTYNAALTLVVEDPVASLQQAAAIAAEAGGFVVSSNIYEVPPDILQPRTPFEDSRAQPAFAQGVQQASITMRVPAERRLQATERLHQLALEVRSESLSGQDITQEFTDLSARVRNLEAAETRLMEIMEARPLRLMCLRFTASWLPSASSLRLSADRNSILSNPRRCRLSAWNCCQVRAHSRWMWMRGSPCWC